MKNIDKNLFRKFMGGFIAAVVAMNFCAANAAATLAGGGNGCDDDDNLYITPALALCDTHVYNIGGTENPSDDATRSLMQEVIGLKTEVITQQMYKQYEYLEATVKRLKTQLKKSVLSAKLEAAGATSDNDSSSSGGGNYGNGISLSGANDCGGYWDKEEVFSCLQRNYNIIDTAVKAGNLGDAKRQLEADLVVADSPLELSSDKGQYVNVPGCQKGTLSSNKTKMNTCMQQYRSRLMNAINDYQDKKKSSGGGYIYVPGVN